MKRLLLTAGLAAGIAMQACTGHNGAGIIPSVPGASGATSVTGLGMDTSHPIQIHGVAPDGYAYTATDRMTLLKATDGGPVARTKPMTIRIALQLRDVRELRLLIASHQVISRDAFVARFAPAANDVQKVVSYLRQQGFRNITIEPNRLIVSADGTAARAESAFRTQIHNFVQRGKSVYANVVPAFVPKSLAGVVIATLGLTDVPAFGLNPYHVSPESGPPAPRPTATTSPSPCTIYGLEILGFPTPLPEDPAVGCLRNYYPADFWRAYDVGNEPSAKKVNVAIMAEGSVTQSISDLRTNEQHDLLTQVPVVVKPVGTSSTDTSGDDEWTLDMLASSGMAGAVKTIYLYDTTSLTDSDITLEYSHFVSDDLAPIGNSSFGGCEAFSYLDGSMLAMDELLNEGAAQGQTMFASTGDTGAYCPVGGAGENGVPAGAPMVNYPASSPYTAAVGGTTLVTQSDGSYQGEATWYSSGGGLSQFEYAPSWETTEQPVASEGESDRGVPDVMMDGDLQTGMNIYLSDVSGGWTEIGGTSLASPLSAGVWARVIQTHGDLYAPPLYYGNFASHAAGSAVTGPPPWQPDGAFHNILAGCDGLYCAGPGYSYAAGLGSFDVTQLIQQI
jgi:pseudomonalisin